MGVDLLGKDRIRDAPLMLVVDRAVQRGHKDRPAALGPRKNNRVLTLSLTQDVVDAIPWHKTCTIAETSRSASRTSSSKMCATPGARCVWFD